MRGLAGVRGEARRPLVRGQAKSTASLDVPVSSAATGKGRKEALPRSPREMVGFGFIACGLTQDTTARKLRRLHRHPTSGLLTTSLTDCALKNGSRQSTAVQPLVARNACRASGVRTMRPSSCVICVLSAAGRKETMTSARGQSHPVLMASFAIKIRTQVDSCARSGEM